VKGEAIRFPSPLPLLRFGQENWKRWKRTARTFCSVVGQASNERRGILKKVEGDVRVRSFSPLLLLPFVQRTRIVRIRMIRVKVTVSEEE